eukprot:TRINITY_DN1568_c1_g1_i1.p2 TRINITY_DN1568_c1_g1~~TRINITY_DN1568_c1_g1_i1.p2  ORF type:complete len:138 (-),score=44.66 TRINITY_DN1568_c1_g1_i1:811-1179(-)
MASQPLYPTALTSPLPQRIPLLAFCHNYRLEQARAIPITGPLAHAERLAAHYGISARHGSGSAAAAAAASLDALTHWLLHPHGALCTPAAVRAFLLLPENRRALRALTDHAMSATAAVAGKR